MKNQEERQNGRNDRLRKERKKEREAVAAEKERNNEKERWEPLRRKKGRRGGSRCE